MGTFPDSLDPGVGSTTQAFEPDWLAYLGLVTYRHASGAGGTQLIPGLATSLPAVSHGGTTYTARLRPGLVFSTGQPVRASDFTYTVERDIRIPWGGEGQFLEGTIAGAAQFAKRRSQTISGITTNDATGQIKIQLLAPYGAFENVLALPALGVVPAGTPLKNEPIDPPPGVGAYMIANVVPGRSFSLVRNPRWTQTQIPGVPAGNVNVDVTVSSNVTANAESVLQNSVDVFDWGDVIPGSVVSEIESHASGRYKRAVMNSTYYFFMNTQRRPFSSQLAREAVIVGLDRAALNRLSSGTLVPGCYFLPPGMAGHPTAPCPYGDPLKADLVTAKQLVTQSGLGGTPVTVWGQTSSPRREWVDYYTSFLNQIGFRATERLIAGPTYFSAMGDLHLDPQTGVADWNQDFPNPIDFYLLLSGQAIRPVDNPNWGQINDPRVNAQIARLAAVPATQLGAVAQQWQTLDHYVAERAYVGVFGYQTFPEFTSSRIDQSSLVFHPVYGWDWSSFRLR